ncbi:MAG: ribonuclease HII [Geminicoccaceae bacterium]
MRYGKANDFVRLAAALALRYNAAGGSDNRCDMGRATSGDFDDAGFFQGADDDRVIAGLDEVGRGPLAGPVVAAAVVLRAPMAGLADSKTLSAPRREMLAEKLYRSDRAFIGLGAASVGEIDRLNILNATMLAMQRALARLNIAPDLALVDGNRLPALPCPAEAVVGGDGRVAAIAAASIVAKVTRDRLMTRLDRRHPGYGWSRNAGYPTAAHREALKTLGPCHHHRMSFAPVKALVTRAASG